MRIFYTSAKTEITDKVIMISPITLELNQIPNCQISLRDFEGGLYDTFKATQYTEIFISNNAADKYIFIGYINDIDCSQDFITLFCKGKSVNLEYSIIAKNYIYANGKIAATPPYAGSNFKAHLQNESGVDFTWADDQWIDPNTTKKGILFTDNNVNLTRDWRVSAYTNSGFDSVTISGAGLEAGANEQDGYYHAAAKTSGTWNGTFVSFDLSGTVIADSLAITRLQFSFRFACEKISSVAQGGVRIEIYNFNTSAWEIFENQNYNAFAFKDGERNWRGVDNYDIIKTNLNHYLDKTGSDYAKFRCRLVCISGSIGSGGQLRALLDKLRLTITYRSADFSPFQAEITDNGNTWVETDVNLTNAGILVNDTFQIGENNAQVITDICGMSNIDVVLNSTSQYYTSRYLRGTYAIQALKNIANIEGWQWAEVYEDDQAYIHISDESDFTLVPGIVQNDIDPNFIIKQTNNSYRYIEVFGNQYFGVYYKYDNGNLLNDRVLPIIDETINTQADAFAVAKSIGDKMNVVRPNIIVTIHGDAGYNFDLGTKIPITFTRPAISEQTLPIRRITRHIVPFQDGHLVTTLHLGLGEPNVDTMVYMNEKTKQVEMVYTPISSESIVSRINHLALENHSQKTRLLIPAAQGGVPLLSHSSLMNLSNDDHTHYYNQTRGDARYQKLNEAVLLSGNQSIAGTKTFTGGITMSGADIAMGTRKLTGLGAGSANGDSVRYEQAVIVDNVNQTIAGVKTFSKAPRYSYIYDFPTILIPAAYNFENDAVGSVPSGFTDLSGAGCKIEIVESYAGHYNVLKLIDGSAATQVSTTTEFTSTASGIVEFYIWTTNTVGDYAFPILDGTPTSVNGAWFGIFNGNFINYDTAYRTLQVAATNTKYHVKIIFNCATTFDIWINGVEYAGRTFRGAPSTMNRMVFKSNNLELVDIYLDALDFSWATGYTEGRNYTLLARILQELGIP